jgi:hypothetical protein
MNLSFLLLIVAALVFRYLAFQANQAFTARLIEVLRFNPTRRRLAAALKDHPERLARFRSYVLPLAARQILLDSVACVILILALFQFAPPGIGSRDLAFLQWISIPVVSLAMAAEGAWLLRTYFAALHSAPAQPL